MKLYSIICILLLTLFLNSCALLRTSSEQTPTVTVLNQVSVQLPKPVAFGFNGSATQILTATYTINNAVKTYSSQVEIEKTPHKLLMVALSGFGAEVFSLQYDGVNIHSTSLPMPNAAMGVKHALADFIFTYAPPDVLNVMLQGTGLQLTGTAKMRVIRYQHKPVIKIYYQNIDPWQGKVTLHNLALHYKIDITTVSADFNHKHRPRN
jgi:hypothetical protein